MNPVLRIKREILLNAQKEHPSVFTFKALKTAAAVQKVWDEHTETWQLRDEESEFRQSGEPTGLECDYCRNYESEAVARRLSDGTWVGWTYFHSDCKHSAEEEIDWLEDAYDLECVEEEKLVVVKTFKRKGKS